MALCWRSTGHRSHREEPCFQAEWPGYLHRDQRTFVSFCQALYLRVGQSGQGGILVQAAHWALPVSLKVVESVSEVLAATPDVLELAWTMVLGSGKACAEDSEDIGGYWRFQVERGCCEVDQSYGDVLPSADLDTWALEASCQASFLDQNRVDRSSLDQAYR